MSRWDWNTSDHEADAIGNERSGRIATVNMFMELEVLVTEVVTESRPRPLLTAAASFEPACRPEVQLAGGARSGLTIMLGRRREEMSRTL